MKTDKEPKKDNYTDELIREFERAYSDATPNVKNIIEPSVNDEFELDEFDLIPIPDEKELNEEELELIQQFNEIEENTRKNYVPITEKVNYLSHLLEHNFTPTLCYSGQKKSFIDAWQETYWIEDITGFWEKVVDHNYDLNFGILTSVAKYRNVSVIDFDVKQFTEPYQKPLIQWIEELIQTDYLQTLVRDKKVYIEKSMSNGFHIVVSIDDLIERKGIKLLDYYGECKPNLKMKEINFKDGEFLETRGKKQHFATYPSLGYSKIHNTLWEIGTVSTMEYESLLAYIMEYFLNVSSKFTKANSHDSVHNDGVTKSNKSHEIYDESNLTQEQKKLAGYQIKFANSGKDIQILQQLLKENGYKFVTTDGDYIHYVHPLSSEMESNFSVNIKEHYLTNFSTNNMDFPLIDSSKQFATYGSLRACYILFLKLNPNSNLNQFYKYLKDEHEITFKRTTEDGHHMMESNKRNFYIHENSVKEISIERNKIQLQRRSRDYVYTHYNFQKPDEKQNCFKNLVDNCTIPKNLKIKYVFGAPPAKQGKYEFDGEKFVYFVKFSEAKKPIQNNKIVTEYFNDIFQDKTAVIFWENWLASFCYHNYWEYDNNVNANHSLPICIFKSVLRSVGKSDVANLALSIFDNHSLAIEGEDLVSDFNAELENRLLYISEAQNLGMKQLNIVKFVGGEKRLLINQKNVAKYSVDNNLCLIFSSNDEVPFFTKFIEKEQLSENFNQFFVWDFIKNPKYEYNEKLYFDDYEEVQNAFPHYVDTFLKDVWENRVLPNRKGKRYIIPVPITSAEIHMFDSNKTKSDHILEAIVEYLLNSNKSFISPDLLAYFASEHKESQSNIVNMLLAKKLVKSKKEPRTINGKNYKVLIVDKVVRDKIAKTYQLI